MNEPEVPEHDLFLIEVAAGEHSRYVLAERLLTVEPDQGAMGISWSEIAALFRDRTLRAVPLPGRVRGFRNRMEGVSTEPGVSTSIEVNLFKIGNKD